MVMLSPSEFSVGNLTAASAEGLTLLWPRGEYDRLMLVAGFADQKWAVFLGGQYGFEAFKFRDNDSHEGILIPGITIEVDTTSIFDPRGGGIHARVGIPLGCLVREEEALAIAANVQDGNHGFRRTQRVPLLKSLAAGVPQQSAGFYRWRVVLGEGDERRELHAIDVSPAAQGQS